MYKKVALVASAILTLERPPAAIAILAGVCEKNAVDYKFFDINLYLFYHFGRDRWEQIGSSFIELEEICQTDPELKIQIDQALDYITNEILEYTPDLVAISSFSALQISWTQMLLRKLREKSTVTVIAGGPGIIYEQQPNKSAGKILAEQNLVDYYVLGEGDQVFHEFLNGIINLGVNHKLDKYETWVPQLDNLDSLTLPTYKKLNINSYKSFLNESEIPITGSRGCVRRCTFCDVGNIWKKFRFRSASSVVSEIEKH
jgi:hypothetical protein